MATPDQRPGQSRDNFGQNHADLGAFTLTNRPGCGSGTLTGEQIAAINARAATPEPTPTPAASETTPAVATITQTSSS